MGYSEERYSITFDSCQCYKHLTKENTINIDYLKIFNEHSMYNKWICTTCYEELTLKKIIANIRGNE
jgi:hypothetical protein